jgi:hypothetical protein
MKSVSNIVSSNSTPAKLGKKLADYEALCTMVRSNLPSPLSQQLKAAVLQAGVLSLFVSSPVWASRLRYTAPQLLKQLQQHGLGIDRIRTRILLEVGKKPSSLKNKTPSLSKHNGDILRQTANSIRDPDLSEALLKLSRHGDKKG